MFEPVTANCDMTLSQKFQLERSKRMIEECNDPVKLKKIAKMAIEAYFAQMALNAWAIKEGDRSRRASEKG
jgi:hypothetical protein